MESFSPQKKEKVIVVALALKSFQINIFDLKEELIELEGLVLAAGGEIVGSLIYRPAKWQPSTLIGKGKIDEIKEMIHNTEADLLIIDHSLTGVQARNLQKILDIPVLDRAQIILDIFASRAQTYEGKLQVELAQKLDQLPRMVGAWLGSLSRQGGGIGAKGPGEKAIEKDRRQIHQRVKLIREKLAQVEKSRSVNRSKRKKQQIPNIALIGYTNSGKSTLLNSLAKSTVVTKDQVFATLDPTSRKVYIKDIGSVIITDTVGFIKKLPPKLIEAFKATLEETSHADVLLHVIDISNKNFESHIKVVDDLIKEFSWQDKPVIYVFNKIDNASIKSRLTVKQSPRIFISALKEEGLQDLKKFIKKFVSLKEIAIKD